MILIRRASTAAGGVLQSSLSKDKVVTDGNGGNGHENSSGRPGDRRSGRNRCCAGHGGRGGKGRGGPQQNGEQQKADQKKKQAIDDAYKSAITRIPDSKEKYDPWKSSR